MLINYDIPPKQNLYYIAALIIKALIQTGDSSIDVTTLYTTTQKQTDDKIYYTPFILSLDWLYLLGVVNVDQNGGLQYVPIRT